MEKLVVVQNVTSYALWVTKVESLSLAGIPVVGRYVVVLYSSTVGHSDAQKLICLYILL